MGTGLEYYEFERPFCDYAELYLWNSVKEQLTIQYDRRRGPIFAPENTFEILVANPFRPEERGKTYVYWQQYLHPSGICTTGEFAGRLVKPVNSFHAGQLGRFALSDGGQWDAHQALIDISLRQFDPELKISLENLLHQQSDATFSTVLALCIEHLGFPIDIPEFISHIPS